ncbi:hypothetical protein CC86DRAFT_440305, partial [Ophiobolus disseminans]
MEAMAAFSLACGVMQTISFSMSAIKAWKDLYEGRTPDADLDSYCARLRETVNNFQPASLATAKGDDKLDQQLRIVAKEIVNAADKLREELEKLKADSQRSRLRAFKGTATYMTFTKRKISTLQSTLEKKKDMMETRVLISLRYAMREASVETDNQLRNFLVHLQNGHTRLEDLVDSRSGEILASVKNENKETRIQIKNHHNDVTRQLTDGFQDTQVHVDSSLNSHRIKQLAEEEMKRFMQSLTYPEMTDRQGSDAINRTHENTFEWILEEGNHREASFREWLKSEEKIYWISGQPASGKSNLMRTITTNSKTRQHLQTWRPRAKVVCAYIWLAGSATQRSQEGVLASLLYQLLLNDPQAKEGLYRNLAPFSKQSLSAWSLRELEDCLHQILRFDDSGVCIFIDGLDEINPDAAGGKDGLVKLLGRISSNPFTKICVASREENVFRDLARLVTQRASGVFLWASVVVNTIVRACQNRDDFQEIKQRIYQLPRDLEDLYEETWNRMNSDDQNNYKAKSALYFRLVL